MGRTKLDIDKADLEKVIATAETNKTFTNRNELAQFIAETEWAKNYKPKPITASVVTLRIQEFKLVIKTPKGKRGRGAGTVLTAGHKAAMLSGRQARSINDPAYFKALKKEAPILYHSTIDKFEAKPTRSLALKLKCLDCAGWQKVEVRNCQCVTCPLFHFRPYK